MFLQMRTGLSWFILIEAIIAKMNYEISMLMGYYNTYIGPKRLSSYQGLDGNISMC